MPSLPVVGALHFGVLATLARLLLPSWRFFDDALTGVVLQVRLSRPSSTGFEVGPWIEVLRPPPRRLHHLLWNPEGNATLAACSLLERLVMDADGDPRAHEVTTRMVEALVRQEIAHLGAPPAGSTFEYRVRDRRPGGDEDLAMAGPIPW